MLSPAEVGRAELVCRSWRRGVREGSDLWRAVAISASSSEAVVEILAAGIRTRYMYRDIAIGLVAPLPPMRQQQLPAPQLPAPQLPEPQLRVEDLALVIQVRRRLGGGGASDGEAYKVVASRVFSDLSGLFENNEIELRLDGDANSGTTPFLFEEKNPMGAGNTAGENPWIGRLDPIQGAASMGADGLLVSCRLFRMDGNRCQHVCLIGTGCGGDGDLAQTFLPRSDSEAFLPPNLSQRESHVVYDEQGWFTDQIPRLASDAAIARRMLSMRQCHDVSFRAEIHFSCLLTDIPPPDAGWARTLREHEEREHRAWVERLGRPVEALAWSDQDREELAQIDRFRFQATKLVVKFDADMDIPQDLSVTDKRLLFEGFDWK